MPRCLIACGLGFALCLLTGCATSRQLSPVQLGLARAAMAGSAEEAAALEMSMTDPQLARLLDADVRAKLPTRLAVAKLHSGYQLSIDEVAGDELRGWEGAIADRPGLTGVRPVSAIVHGPASPTIQSLRTAAARMSCELLLVYLQDDAWVDNYNNAAVLYWTGLGLWTVPGNVMEHRTVAQAILIDTRTGMVLGTATGESHLTRTYPAAFEDQRRAELSREAPKEAVAELQTAAAEMLASTLTPPAAEAVGAR